MSHIITARVNSPKILVFVQLATLGLILDTVMVGTFIASSVEWIVLFHQPV